MGEESMLRCNKNKRQTKNCRRWREGPSASGGEGGSKTCGRDVAGGGAEAGKNADADGCGRGAGRARRSGREGGLTRCEGQVVGWPFFLVFVWNKT